MLLPDDYLRQVAAAVHEHGGMFVLDCIASGTIWVDMKSVGVDVLISAPQKGWSGSPCAAFVMLNEAARDAALSGSTTSFACDLGKWLEIMQAYENGAHAYHATMPTDALAVCRNVMKETEAYGFDKVCAEQQELGDRVRALLADKGIQSVAAPGFEAPGVVVCYTDDPDISSGGKFVAAGMQIAAGVPLKCDEPDNFRTFRLGLFGLDKLHNVERTVAKFCNRISNLPTINKNNSGELLERPVHDPRAPAGGARRRCRGVGIGTCRPELWRVAPARSPYCCGAQRSRHRPQRQMNSIFTCRTWARKRCW
jgi:aspartate aminotransferase-like enzyme